jgi:hypothetical protein
MRTSSLVPLSFLCLVATLTAACSFDASRLRATASHGHDGAIEYPAAPDVPLDRAHGGGTTSLPDASLGGSGGAAGQPGAGGSTSTDASAASPDRDSATDVAVSDDLAVARDLAAANEVDFPAEIGPASDAEADVPAIPDAPATGGVLADGGNPATGGTPQTGGAVATGGATGSGGATSSGGTASSGGTPNSGGTFASGGTIGTVTTTCPGAVPAGITSSWCSCLAQGNLTSGGYLYTNNIWGSGAGSQCIWTTATTQWGVAANHPNTLNIKSYPNVSLSPQKVINAITSYTSSFDVTVPSSGSWMTAYTLSVKGSSPGRVQISLWVNQNGPVVPTSTVGGGAIPTPDWNNVRVGGHVWDVYLANNNAITFVRTSDINSGSVDILAILRWLIANNNTSQADFTANWTLDQLQFGFDITSDGTTQAFVTNSFSVTSN